MPDQKKLVESSERFHTNMRTFISTYPISADASAKEISSSLSDLERIINDANTIFSVLPSSITDDYDGKKKKVLNLLAGEDGIVILQSKLIELEK